MENIRELIEKFEQKVVEVPINRSYWLVRTDSGLFYNDFIEKEYISIGWNEFSEKEYFINKQASEYQRKEIKNKYPEKQETRIYNQIRKFIFDIKRDDVVMIPSENSKIINFGIVKSDYYKREIDREDGFIKARKVEWIKPVSRDNLDPYLYRMMQAHQTINNAKRYAHYIDRTMYSLYNKGDRCYLNVKVGKKGHLAAYDLSMYLNSILMSIELTNTFDINNYSSCYSIEDLDIKVNVQSKGWSLLSGAKELVIKYGAVTNSALYSEIENLTSIDETNKRGEIINQIRNGMKKANAELPEDLQ
jgi:restriction system protein